MRYPEFGKPLALSLLFTFIFLVASGCLDGSRAPTCKEGSPRTEPPGNQAVLVVFVDNALAQPFNGTLEVRFDQEATHILQRVDVNLAGGSAMKAYTNDMLAGEGRLLLRLTSTDGLVEEHVWPEFRPGLCPEIKVVRIGISFDERAYPA